MRVPRVRITVRRMMVAVAVTVIVAVAVRAADLMVNLDARVASRFLKHTWTLEGAPDPLTPPSAASNCTVDFWPRFWRGFLGRPWPGGYVCECEESGSIPVRTGVGIAPRRYLIRGTQVVSGEDAELMEGELLSVQYRRPIIRNP